ncbi:MAG TPA: flagellar hook-length control protein FliK [Gaiellales bacterium]|nr:flagellar hook-length control protein FliK [Gaiellales bacterium]
MDVTTLARQVAAGVLLEELALRPGTDLVVRVQAAPPNGGRGMISLAGVLLSAQLPAGLAPGQRLPVRVVRSGGDEVLLRLKTEADAAPLVAPLAAPAARVAQVAGTLALAGDGQLVQVANALQQPGLALPLPNGDALTLAVAEDEEAAARGGAGEGGREASFVLHSATLGPIEAHLRLVDGALRVEVTVEPEARRQFAEAAPALVSALERAVSGPALVGVAARRPQHVRPARPRVDESFDAYA